MKLVPDNNSSFFTLEGTNDGASVAPAGYHYVTCTAGTTGCQLVNVSKVEAQTVLIFHSIQIVRATAMGAVSATVPLQYAPHPGSSISVATTIKTAHHAYTETRTFAPIIHTQSCGFPALTTAHVLWPAHLSSRQTAPIAIGVMTSPHACVTLSYFIVRPGVPVSPGTVLYHNTAVAYADSHGRATLRVAAWARGAPHAAGSIIAIVHVRRSIGDRKYERDYAAI
jgi:hypothetical protein